MNDHPPASDFAADSRRAALAHARTTSRSIAHVLRQRQLYIRRSSVWSDRSDDPILTPTLPLLLSGQGSSGTPLKLYLLLLWVAGSPGGPRDRWERRSHLDRLEGAHTALLDFDEIADLLLVEGYEPRASNRGYRLISSTLRRLRDEHLIELSDDERSIRLLAEDRSSNPYTDPGSAYKEGPSNADRYIRLPHQFFTCGWFSALSAPAVLALLVHRWHWVDASPRSAGFNAETLARYSPVSKSTMNRGERLLTHWGVLDRTERRFPGRGMRSRFEYRLRLDSLNEDCPSEIPPTFR